MSKAWHPGDFKVPKLELLKNHGKVAIFLGRYPLKHSPQKIDLMDLWYLQSEDRFKICTSEILILSPSHEWQFHRYPLVMTNIATENGHRHS